ncbi:hypothetical protein C8R43DRAFT_1120868 [Mycena crocata]|nr:hypothetical protein C8R43DRAFT_1120868 [Mycena crocata]
MHNNMIVCISALGPGHCMPIDLNIEQLIGYLQILLQAKGMESTWDRLGNISAAIIHLQQVKKTVATALYAACRNTGHTTPDTSEMVWRVQQKVVAEGLQCFQTGRANNGHSKLATDILMTREAKLKSSTLRTFNKKLAAMIAGRGSEEEEHECPAIAFGVSEESEE